MLKRYPCTAAMKYLSEKKSSAWWQISIEDTMVRIYISQTLC